MMKKEILLAMLMAVCAANVLGADNKFCWVEYHNGVYQRAGEPIFTESKQIRAPKVLIAGAGLNTIIDEDLKLSDIVYFSFGTEQQAKTILVKYDKQRKFTRTGMLKRLNQYPKAKEHIKRGNAVLCPCAVSERDPRNNFDTVVDVIVYKTQDPNICTKVSAWHEQQKKDNLRLLGFQC